jgi:hypothetical protein
MHAILEPGFVLTGKRTHKNADLAPTHNFGLNKIARFARMRAWTIAAATEMQNFILEGKMKDGTTECEWEDFDPMYCETIGLDIPALLTQINDFIAIEDRKPFPTIIEIMREKRREARQHKSMEVYDLVNGRLLYRIELIRANMPKRKTYKAQRNADHQYIDLDRKVIFYRQQIERLYKFDPTLKSKLYARYDRKRRYG